MVSNFWDTDRNHKEVEECWVVHHSHSHHISSLQRGINNKCSSNYIFKKAQLTIKLWIMDMCDTWRVGSMLAGIQVSTRW